LVKANKIGVSEVDRRPIFGIMPPANRIAGYATEFYRSTRQHL
jgi:hypothetical protein